jgi:hypothetical protein
VFASPHVPPGRLPPALARQAPALRRRFQFVIVDGGTSPITINAHLPDHAISLQWSLRHAMEPMPMPRLRRILAVLLLARAALERSAVGFNVSFRASRSRLRRTAMGRSLPVAETVAMSAKQRHQSCT